MGLIFSRQCEYALQAVLFLPKILQAPKIDRTLAMKAHISIKAYAPASISNLGSTQVRHLAEKSLNLESKRRKRAKSLPYTW